MTPLLLVLALLFVQDDAPSGTLTLNGGAKATRLPSVRVEAKLGSPGAGEVQMSLTVGEQPASWMPFREVSFLDLPGPDGEKKVTLRLRDKNGKESEPVSAAIRLDTVPPVVKVEAPERVPGSELRLTLESADAVGMQYTENIASWSAWESFSTPKTIALSKGAGAKQVFVRFRDEAGNETVPARLQVEAQDPNASAPPDGIRSVSLALRRNVENLELTVWVYGSGLQEIQAELDGVEVLARIPFVPSWKAQIAPAPGPRRLVVKAWDAAGREHRAEAVFQEQDLPAVQMSNAEELSGPWRVDLMGGILIGGVAFDARTSAGDREIKRAPLPLVRLQIGTEIVGPVYAQLAGEWARGSDIQILSGGLDVGVRFALGHWEGMRFEIRGEIGVYYSNLDVSTSGFEEFRGSVLFRAGVALGVELAEQLWLELLLDFRFVNYSFKGDVLFGDIRAKGPSGAAIIGLSWRF